MQDVWLITHSHTARRVILCDAVDLQVSPSAGWRTAIYRFLGVGGDVLVEGKLANLSFFGVESPAGLLVNIRGEEGRVILSGMYHGARTDFPVGADCFLYRERAGALEGVTLSVAGCGLVLNSYGCEVG